MPRQHAEDMRAVTRARIAVAYHALRRVGEEDIRQTFAFRLAALAATVAPGELEAARARLLEERDAMLNALRTKLEGEEKEYAARELAQLTARQAGTRCPNRTNVPASTWSGRFRKVAHSLIKRREALRPARPRQAASRAYRLERE